MSFVACKESDKSEIQMRNCYLGFDSVGSSSSSIMLTRKECELKISLHNSFFRMHMSFVIPLENGRDKISTKIVFVGLDRMISSPLVALLQSQDLQTFSLEDSLLLMK